MFTLAANYGSVSCFVIVLISCQLHAQTILSPESQQAFQRVLSPQADRVAIAKNKSFTVRIARDPYSRFLAWNQIAMEVTAADHARGPNEGYDQLGPHRSSRAMAIIHLAMYDSVSAITRKYNPYSQIADADAKACLDTAISESARNTLVALFPREQLRINNAYKLDEAWARAGCQSSTTDSGMGKSVGAEAASRILNMPANDNSKFDERDAGTMQQAAANPTKYIYFPEGVGKWQPDPISKIPVALGYDWGKVKPFVIDDVASFRPLPPPAITDARYAAEFNEVKLLGSTGSLARKPAETTAGTFWAYDGTPELCAPPRLYNQFALQVVEQNQLATPVIMDVSDLARYLAAINTAMADTAIVAWETKWREGFWRPITAITSMVDDGNAQTTPDPAFTPLGAPATNGRGPNFTPPFPAYPSGHAAFGGALFGMMREYFPENTSVNFISDEYNGLNKDADGKTRQFHSEDYFNFTQPEWENARSRIWLGIHWQVDADAGIILGRKVAAYVAKNAFQPR